MSDHLAMYDASDSKQVEKRAKAAKTKDEVRAEGLLQTMTSIQGRAWLHGLLDSCGPYRTPFSRDPVQMAFNCGTSDVGLKLIAECHACSTELYLQMMKENANG